MNSHRSSQICCSILLVFGFSQPVFIEIPQSLSNGTVGNSVLLSVTYKFNRSFHHPLSIQWNFSNTTDPLTIYTITNCSVSAEGIPTHCSGHNYTHLAYQGRIVFFPENASLLLQNLQLSDSGVYSITFKVPQQTRHITLIVSEPHFNHGNAGSNSEGEKDSSVYIISFIAVGGCCFILLFLLLLSYCRWLRGAVPQKKVQIIKQQEVENPEESHMENSSPRRLPTIYIRVGEDCGQRQPTSESHTEYTSISFSEQQL